jgi:hypothetical protein
VTPPSGAFPSDRERVEPNPFHTIAREGWTRRKADVVLGSVFRYGPRPSVIPLATTRRYINLAGARFRDEADALEKQL